MKSITEMTGLAEVTLIKRVPLTFHVFGPTWANSLQKKSLVLLLELKTGRFLRNAIVGAPAIPHQGFRRNSKKWSSVQKIICHSMSY
jgi:hypothetical protein